MAKRAKKSKSGRKGGSRIGTLINLAAAAAGLVSLARDLMQRHEEAKRTAAAPARMDGPDRDADEAPAPSPGGVGAGGLALRAVDAALDAAQGLIDLNAAPTDARRQLNPITKKRAKRIVAHRPFRDVKELKRVLPRNVYKAIRQQLTV